jgi:hypothetical protein
MKPTTREIDERNVGDGNMRDIVPLLLLKGRDRISHE